MRVAAFVFAVALLVACGGDSEDVKVSPTVAPQSSPTLLPASPTPVTPSSPATPPPRITATPLTGVPSLAGLDTKPRNGAPAAVRQIAAPTAANRPQPDVTFSYDNARTVLYDIGALTATDLGPGERGTFSPDSRLMTWTGGTLGKDGFEEVFVIDLNTKRRWSLGKGATPGFVEPGKVALRRCGITCNDWVLVDVDTLDEKPYFLRIPAQTEAIGGDIAGGSVQLVARDEVAKTMQFAFFDLTNRPLFQFTAAALSLAGPNQLVVAAVPEGVESNLYLVTLPQGSVEYLATIAGDKERFSIFPIALAVSDDFVAWNYGYCADIPGKEGSVGVYNRRARTVTQIKFAAGFMDGDGVKLTPQGYLALGSFGPTILFDPVALKYVAVLQDLPGDRSWSRDYRYASGGIIWAGGHGGTC
jgi:hypothetical protein